jgi:hypothetical protein
MLNANLVHHFPIINPHQTIGVSIPFADDEAVVFSATPYPDTGKVIVPPPNEHAVINLTQGSVSRGGPGTLVRTVLVTNNSSYPVSVDLYAMWMQVVPSTTSTKPNIPFHF